MEATQPVMPEKQGIKEIMEVLEAAKVLAETAASVMKDGKVGISDLPLIASMALKIPTFAAAVENIKAVGVEAKDLDEAEAKEIIGKVFEILAAVKEQKQA